MDIADVDLSGRRSLPWRLIARFLAILLVTSCAAGPGKGSPTPPALPSFPAMTPIRPGEEPSPTPSASPTAAPTAEPPPTTESGTLHTVQAGDTLLGLAKQYGVSMAAIQVANEMGASTVVKAGQTLTIPSEKAWEGASPFWIVHEVRPGETLIGIARGYDVEIEDLQAVNSLDDADRIVVGQQLILPLRGPGPAPTAVPTEVPAPSATPLPEPTATSSATSTVSSGAATSSSVAPTSAPPADLVAWPQQIAKLINEVRVQHGLEPFAYNQTLEQAAQAHANDCAQRGWCSHTGSDGANIKTRIIRTGYEASGWAECWAQTQTPQRAVEVWMDETPPNDPHRRTLLSDWFSEIGLGVSEADWGHYIIANFGRP